jgi:dolichol-phosphate mannosyltransferase
MIGRLSIRRLRNISDCTGGYFGLKRKVIEGVKLDPIGWKILIEVLVKGNYHTVHEIPYSFFSRSDGESKMSVREQWNYILHIIRLMRNNTEDLRFYTFCIVGLLGVFVNMLTLFVLVNIIGIYGMAASAGASVIAMTHNFILNDRITWRDHKSTTALRHTLQLLQFIGICSIGILITALFVQSFLSIDWSIYIGQLIGIMVATYWNFAVNNRFTWSNKASEDMEDEKCIVTQECSREIS